MATTIHGCLLFLVVAATNFYGAHSTTELELEELEIRHYNGTTLSEYQAATVGEAETLVSNMNLSKPTMFYCPGWTESMESQSISVVIGAYMELQTWNILVGNWTKIAGQNYVTASLSVDDVGAEFAKALNRMIAAGIEIGTLHVVGHSMGVHVVGALGREMNGSLSRITGLDPAGPLYNEIETPLTAADAEFVDIIHTDMGGFGTLRLLGHANFRPNNGERVQSGCPLLSIPFSTDDFCSHHRSWWYWAESLLNNDAFVGVSCSLVSSFETNSCSNNTKVLMGIATPNTTNGTYFLQTNSASPFGRGENGTTYYSTL